MDSPSEKSLAEAQGLLKCRVWSTGEYLVWVEEHEKAGYIIVCDGEMSAESVHSALDERDARISEHERGDHLPKVLSVITRMSYAEATSLVGIWRDDRVKALEAEVSSLKELARRYHDEAARDLEIRVKTVEVRKAQLRRHGTHTGDCKRFGTPPECTCGWTAIAEGLHGD